MEEIQPLDPAQASASSAIGRRVLALNNGARRRSCRGSMPIAWSSWRAGPSSPAASAPSRPSCSPSTRTPTTTAPISCGSARAIGASCMSTASSWRLRHADAAMPAGCTTTFSSTLFAAPQPRTRRLRGQPRAAQSRVGCLPCGAGLQRGRPRRHPRWQQDRQVPQARAFSRSRISVSSSWSLVGGAGGGGASCSFSIRRLMPLITRNRIKAMMMKLTVTVMKLP